MKSTILIIAIIAILPMYVISQDTNALMRDSTELDTFINPDSLLYGASEKESIAPYRLEEKQELYPAQDLYKIWNREFLTPSSFPQSTLPDTFSILIKDFEFPTLGKVSSPFGYRKPRQHYGIDLKVQMKDTIRAAFSGRVRLERYEARGYGYYIVIRHPNGLETIYAHLAKFLVKVDQLVKAGQPIALGDNTGRSSGAHLHFETRFMGNPIDPATMVDFNSKSLLSQTYVYRNPARKITKTSNSSGLLARSK